MKGRRIDDEARPEPVEELGHRRRVADVEVLVGEAADVFGGERLDDVAPELPRAAEHHDAGQNTPPMRLRVASISARSSIHWML